VNSVAAGLAGPCSWRGPGPVALSRLIQIKSGRSRTPTIRRCSCDVAPAIHLSGPNVMKYSVGLVVLALVLAGARASDASVRIADDPGGRIGKYVYKYQRLRASGQAVIIDGLCASACTIVLSTIPADRICVTSQAELAFHAAWDFGFHGKPVTNPEATEMLYSMYPAPVRRWIAHRGGLTSRTIFLHGKPLQTMYRSC
jgi:hypothetical protein